MSTQEEKFILAQFVKTTSKRNLILETLSEVSKLLFEVNNNALEVLKAHFSIEVIDLLRVDLDTSHPSEIHEALIHFKKNLLDLPLLNLTVVRELTIDQTEEIIVFIHEQIGIPLILELEIEPALLGGALLQYQGKSADFSVRTKIETSLEAIVAQL